MWTTYPTIVLPALLMLIAKSVSAECVDRRSNCNTFQSTGQCGAQFNGQSVRRYWCPKTCGKCVVGYRKAANADFKCSNITNGPATLAACAAKCNSDSACIGFLHGTYRKSTFCGNKPCCWTKSQLTCPRTRPPGQPGKLRFFRKNLPAATLQPSASVPVLGAGVVTGGSCPDNDNAILTAHNQLRARHGAPALTWDLSLVAEAQAWGAQLAVRGCGLQHRTDGYGQNLWSGWWSSSATPSSYSCTGATNAWYNEIRDYRFTARPYSDSQGGGQTGHFTQLVWAATTRVGCYWSRGSQNGEECAVVTCNYSPPGNTVYNGDADGSYYANVRALIAG